MNLPRHLHQVLAISLAASGTALGAAHSEGPDKTLIDELLVVAPDTGYRATESATATRLNIPLEEIPINIQVVTEDLIQDFELTSQRDALQFTSSVDDKRVRGFNTNEFFRNGFIHLSDTPGYAIQRMEILRGPTAVLNGPTTSAGAINVITKRATLDDDFGEFGGYWGFGDDSRDNVGINVDINAGDIMPEASYGATAAFRFVGGFQEDTGFNTDVPNEQHALLPTLRLRPWENTFIDLEYYQYEINSDRTDRAMGAELSIPGPGGTEIPLATAYGIDPRSTWFASDTDITESLDDISIGVQHAFNEQFLMNLRFNRHDRTFEFGPGQRPRIDIFFAPVQVSGPMGSTDPADYQVRRRTEFLKLTNEIDQFAADFTWLPGWGDDAEDHSITAGFATYSQNQSLNIRRPFSDPDMDGVFDTFLSEFFDPAQIEADRASGALAFNSAGDDFVIRTVLNRAEEITLDNIYLNYQGRLFDDRLSVVGGLTLSDIELQRSQPADSPAMTTDNDEVLLQLGAVFFATDYAAIYANYSESQLPDINDPDFAVARIRESDMIEIGARLELLDDRLAMNFGYYQIEEKVSGTDARTAESDGFDFDLYYYPIEDVEVVFGWSSNDTEITASSDPSRIGDPLADEVTNKFSLWTKYDIDDGPLAGFAFGGGLIWLDDRPRPVVTPSDSVKKDASGNVLKYDSETRLDLFATYTNTLGADENWEYVAALNLRNLTEDINISNTVPRVPLQGGVDSGGNTSTFDGSTEIMLSLRVRYR